MSLGNPGVGGYLIGAGLLLCGAALLWGLRRRRRLRAARDRARLRHPVYRAGRAGRRVPGQRRAVDATAVPPRWDDRTALMPRMADCTELIPRQRSGGAR